LDRVERLLEAREAEWRLRTVDADRRLDAADFDERRDFAEVPRRRGGGNALSPPRTALLSITCRVTGFDSSRSTVARRALRGLSPRTRVTFAGDGVDIR
jgi:hypothetical protein